MNPAHIRVLLVDDHRLVRQSLSSLFETYDDIEVVGEAGDGEAAIAECERLQPDVVLMDMMMPVMDGLTATHFISQHYPGIKVIILTSSEKSEDTQAAYDAGAAQYLTKHAPVTRLVQALRVVASQ